MSNPIANIPKSESSEPTKKTQPFNGNSNGNSSNNRIEPPTRSSWWSVFGDWRKDDHSEEFVLA